MGVDPGPELEEDPGHDAVARACSLHQGCVTILVVVLQLNILDLESGLRGKHKIYNNEIRQKFPVYPHL